MKSYAAVALASLATVATAAPTPGAAAGGSISITPHDMYSSSIGVLGCKINTNRVAYWPEAVTPDNMCVEVTVGSRKVNLLKIDQSGGAHDISYDAWVYLQSGKTAAENPMQGGGVAATYKSLPLSSCSDLINTPDKSLPLSAANSMNFWSNYEKSAKLSLWNIQNSACTLGYDEKCTINLAVSNQASCPHQLGLQTPLTSDPVYNIQYGTGKKVLATQ